MNRLTRGAREEAQFLSQTSTAESLLLLGEPKHPFVVYDCTIRDDDGGDGLADVRRFRPSRNARRNLPPTYDRNLPPTQTNPTHKKKLENEGRTNRKEGRRASFVAAHMISAALHAAIGLVVVSGIHGIELGEGEPRKADLCRAYESCTFSGITLLFDC